MKDESLRTFRSSDNVRVWANAAPSFNAADASVSTMILVTGVHAKVCSLPLATASLTGTPATACDQGMTRSASEFLIALWVIELLKSGIDRLANVRDFEVRNR